MRSISLPTSSWAQWYESPWMATGFTLREWQWASWRLAPLASAGQLQTMMFWGVSTDGWLVRCIEIRIFFDLAKWYSDETVIKDMMPHQTQTNSALSLLRYEFLLKWCTKKSQEGSKPRWSPSRDHQFGLVGAAADPRGNRSLNKKQNESENNYHNLGHNLIDWDLISKVSNILLRLPLLPEYLIYPNLS